MNIDETLIEQAVTEKTKAVVPVHYAGVACEMDTIMDIAGRHNLKVVEDAAQGVKSTYYGKALGTLGDFGCFSFHETKTTAWAREARFSATGRGIRSARKLSVKRGTNRSKFFRGQVDKYTWMDCGSSYLPSDINAAFLLGQFEIADVILLDRMKSWERYYNGLLPLAEEGFIELPAIPEGCAHNAHMFFISRRRTWRSGRSSFHSLKAGISRRLSIISRCTMHRPETVRRVCREDKYTTVKANGFCGFRCIMNCRKTMWIMSFL